MENIVAILAHKEQAFTRPIVFGRMTTHRTRLTGKVGVHFHRHASLHKGFIGKHAVQLCECPLALSGVGLTLFLTCTFAFASLGAFSNVRQVLKANDR